MEKRRRTKSNRKLNKLNRQTKMDIYQLWILYNRIKNRKTKWIREIIVLIIKQSIIKIDYQYHLISKTSTITKTFLLKEMLVFNQDRSRVLNKVDKVEPVTYRHVMMLDLLYLRIQVEVVSIHNIWKIHQLWHQEVTVKLNIKILGFSKRRKGSSIQLT